MFRVLHEIRDSQGKPGAKRRALMLSYVEASPENRIYINRKYCIILKQDRDLRYLMKKGKLIQCRELYSRCRGVSYLTSPIHKIKDNNVSNS